ncbi:MAG TPA: hypothetical protein VJG48_03500, partial [Candidatus Paceibacterota bacterium]
MKSLGPKIWDLRICVLVGLCVLVFGASQVFAATSAFNKQINYQGKLTNSAGTTVSDGDYNIEFKIYTASTGGTLLWTETRTGTDKVTVTNGLFSVLLGSVTSLAGLNYNQDLYLSVNIGGTGAPSWDGEMTPRKRFGTVPAAFVADTLDGLDSDAFIRSDVVGTSTGGLLVLASTTFSATTTFASTLSVGTSTPAFNPYFIVGSTSPIIYIDRFTGRIGIQNSVPIQALDVIGNVGIDTGSAYKYNNTNIAFGITAIRNWFLGNAGNLTVTGVDNTGVGDQALLNVSTGVSNTAVGSSALKVNSSGQQNTAMGNNALASNLGGDGNFALGFNTLATNESGSYNTALGYSSMRLSTSSSYNVAIGDTSMTSAQSSYSVGVGGSTLQKDSGWGNVGVGSNAGTGDGSNIGNQSWFDTYSTFLGYNASRDSSVATETPLTNATAIGASSTVGCSNCMALGGTSTMAVKVGIGTSTPFATLAVAGTSSASNFYAFGTATSTANNGINLNVGCFSILGTCVGGGSTLTGSGAANRVTFWTSASNLSSSANFTWDGTTLGLTGVQSLSQSGTLAAILGDTTGNARGTSALDIQSTRDDVTKVASGDYASAFGALNTAAGAYSSAIGYSNIAVNDYDFAFGYGNSADGLDSGSVAVGYSNTVSVSAGSAFGVINTSNGFYALAAGGQNAATANYASAVGYNNTSSGQNSSAFGYSNSATHARSSALGYQNFAYATDSTAVGAANQANGTSSSAFGYGTIANASLATVLGASITNSATNSVMIGTRNVNGPGNVLLTPFGGNTGIGTTSPWAKLSVAGMAADGQQPLLTISSSTQSGTTTVFHVDYTGKVGIGTTSPFAALSVVGSTGVVADIYTATNTTATSTFAGFVSTKRIDLTGTATNTAAQGWN